MTLDDEIAIDNWLLKDFDPEQLHALKDEEDEPDWHPVLVRAKARAAQGDADGQLIGTLLQIIQHYDNTLDAYYWNASDNGELPHGA